MREPFQPILRGRRQGQMGGGTNRFSSLGSSLPHPGPPSSRRPPGRASRSGAGQPKNARHATPATLLPAARTQEQLPRRIPLLSTCWFCCWRPSVFQAAFRALGGGSPPSVPSRGPSQVPAPASIWCLPTLPTRKALAYSDPLPPGHIIVAAHSSLSW